MNKRRLLFILAIILFYVVVLRQFDGVDGYYSTVEDAVNHEKEVAKGAKKIALINNGSGYIYIMTLDDSIVLYGLKSKDKLTGKKYAVLSILTKTIDYDTLSDSLPAIEDRNVFPKLVFNQPDVKDLYWYVVKASNDLTIENTINKYEYEHNGDKYYLLCSLDSD